MIPNVYQIVMSDSEAAAVVAGRFYKAGVAPQGVVSPYAVWSFVYGEGADVLDGPPPAERFIVQVDCWGATSASVDELYVAVRTCFEKSGYATMVADLRDPVTNRYRKSMRVALWNLR